MFNDPSSSIAATGAGVNRTVDFAVLDRLTELTALQQFVLWQEEQRPGQTKPAKVPKTPRTGTNAAADDPSTWGLYSQAKARYQAGGYAGVGFELAPPHVGIDLDAAYNPETGQVEPWARAIVDALPTYWEISPSGRGLHGIGRGALPAGGNRKGRIELYGSGRYFTMTGHHLPGTPLEICDISAALAQLHANLFPAVERPSRPTPAVPSTIEDRELLAIAMQARNGEAFQALWRGDTSAHGGDWSAADLALCNHLAFYTGGDHDRIDCLFRQSGLMRPKWDERHYGDGRTYGEATIRKAIDEASAFYGADKECLPREVKVQDVKKTPAPVVEDTDDDQVIAGAFHLTDMGNAERLVARYGGQILYCGKFGKWLCWDERRFGPDEDGEVERRMKATVRAIYEEALAEPDSTKRKAILKHAMRSEGEQRIRAAISLARSEELAPVSADALDANPMLLCCLNGTVDLRTGLLLPHRREDLITKIAGAIYNPDAQCPQFLAFLNLIFEGNQGLITFVQRAVGYSLTAYTVERIIFILHGLGANGKSTLLEVIGAALGDYALHTPTETLMVKKTGSIPNDLARLKGARFVSATESEEGKRLAESLIKSLSGNDTINARFLHQEWFQFVPQCKIWLGTNHKPVIRGGDQAIWDRIRLIPFNVRIPPPEDPEHPKEGEQDKFFGEKLRAELPGILAWAVQGCLDWQRKGLTMPPEVRRATESYRAEMDVLTGFLDECCVVGERGTTLSAGTLHKAYATWCEANGEEAQSQRALGIQLKERGFTSGRASGGGRQWKRIRLKTPAEQLEQEPTDGDENA